MKSTPDQTLRTNYIWISHLADGEGEYLFLPTEPDKIDDNMQSTFSQADPIARSAPVYAWSKSGPRSISFSFPLHRDMMYDANVNKSNYTLDPNSTDDYIDLLIKKLQAVSVPRYVASTSLVQPPTIAIRIGDGIFIRGIVNGSISVAYEKPILSDGKYALATVSFSVTEVDPYDAATIVKKGSFRGLTKTLKDRFG